jgi:hypothetical protein
MMASLPLLQEVSESPRVALAVGRFIERVLQAVLRDLERHPSLAHSSTELSPEDEAAGIVLRILATAMSANAWRGWLVPGHARALRTVTAHASEMTWPRQLDPDHEAAILGLCQAMQYILEPWFTDQTAVHYGHLWDLFPLLHPAAGVWLPQTQRDDLPTDPGQPLMVLRAAQQPARRPPATSEKTPRTRRGKHV